MIITRMTLHSVITIMPMVKALKEEKEQPFEGSKGGKGVKGRSVLGNRIHQHTSSLAGDTNITENVKPVVCDFCHSQIMCVKIAGNYRH